MFRAPYLPFHAFIQSSWCKSFCKNALPPPLVYDVTYRRKALTKKAVSATLGQASASITDVKKFIRAQTRWSILLQVEIRFEHTTVELEMIWSKTNDYVSS